MRKMKDSGVEWIGEIPEDWDVKKFKLCILQNDGGIWGNDPDETSQSIVLRSTEQTVDGHWCISNPAKRDLSCLSNTDYFLCKENDLLITKSSGSDFHIGKTTIVDKSIEDMNCYYSNFMQRIRLNFGEYAKYYWYILNSSISREQFVYMQNSTSGIGNINSKYISNLIIPSLNYDTQKQITSFLDEKCSRIDDAVKLKEELIEKLNEYKKSLIYEAVTGKREI